MAVVSPVPKRQAATTAQSTAARKPAFGKYIHAFLYCLLSFPVLTFVQNFHGCVALFLLEPSSTDFRY
jgi:hypothetical protein